MVRCSILGMRIISRQLISLGCLCGCYTRLDHNERFYRVMKRRHVGLQQVGKKAAFKTRGTEKHDLCLDYSMKQKYDLSIGLNFYACLLGIYLCVYSAIAKVSSFSLGSII